MPIPLPDDVRRLLSKGKRIEAIRRLCDDAGLSLKDAAAAVGSGEMPAAKPPITTDTGLPPEVNEALAAGNTIEAIKRLREATGLDLKQAKEIIDKSRS
jgi:ribosomal protein L7/L12